MDALGIDFKLLIAQLVNFLLFFLIFKKYIAKPFQQYISREKEALVKQQNSQKLAEEIIEKAKSSANEIIDEAKKKSQFLIKENEKEALNQKKVIIDKANNDILVQRSKLESQYIQKREKMHKDIKKYIINYSVLLSRKVLKNYIDQSKQSQIISNLTNKIAKEIKYEN